MEKDSEKKYLIDKIVKILNSIDNIDLLKYLLFFIQFKAEKKAR